MSGRTEAVIDRESDCDISIRDEGSSRHHARLVRDGDTLFIEDLGSTNGTKANGHNVIKRSPGASVQVRIGATVFELAIPTSNSGWAERRSTSTRVILRSRSAFITNRPTCWPIERPLPPATRSKTNARCCARSAKSCTSSRPKTIAKACSNRRIRRMQQILHVSPLRSGWERTPHGDRRGSDLGWGTFAQRGVDTEILSGDHVFLMKEPRVRELARALQECLGRAASAAATSANQPQL